MTQNRSVAVLVVVALLILSLGCSRNPEVRKQKYYQSGNSYFDKGMYREAVLEFSNAIKLDPNFAKAHYQLAEAYIRLEQWPEAYRELKRTIELDPDDVKPRLRLGNLLGASQSFQEARAIADKILLMDPNNADAHILRANVSIAQGDRDGGINEINKAISLDPNRPEFYVQLAALQGASQIEEAEATLRKALTVDPFFTLAMESLASIYQANGRSLEAEKLLEKAVELNPKNVGSRRQLARLYWLDNRKIDAERLMVQGKKDLGGEGYNYRILGDYYNDVGEADKALAEFASLAREHPRDIRTKEDYIRLLLSHHRTEEAGRLNDAILKENPKDLGAQIIRGTMLNSQGSFYEACRILEDAVNAAPDNALGHYQFGVALSNTGNLPRAEQEWLIAAKLAPGMSEVQMALVQAARSTGDHRLLRESAEQLIQNNPSDPRGYILRAESKDPRTQAPSALSDLEKAIEVAPLSGMPYSAMGDFLRIEGKKKEARQYYEQALERDPNGFEPLAGIVALLVEENQNKKAIERVQAQIAKTRDNDSLLALLGGLQIAGKDLLGAEASLQNAVKLNSANADASILLSKVQMAQGKADSALATAYKSIADNPKNATAYFFAGTLEELRGRPEKAEEVYKKALEIEPNYGPAANNLAYLMVENGEDTTIALSLAQIARQRTPDSPSTADTLAWVYYHKGLYNLASDLLEEAIRMAPNNGTYHYHMGIVCEKQNNFEAARRHFKRALEINPKDPHADDIRRIFKHLN